MVKINALQHEEISTDWVDALRLPLIVAVVLVHAYEPVRAKGAILSIQNISEISDFITFLVSQVFCRIAVPAFFIVSGYFFIKCKIDQLNLIYLRGAMLKRMRTIGVPYLLWNSLLAVALYLLMTTKIYQPDEASKYYAALSGDNLKDFVLSIYGIGRPPIAYQFWFLRDLIFACVAGGAILILGRMFTLGSLLILFAAWFLGYSPDHQPQITALLFFLIGVCFREINAFTLLAQKVPRKLFYLYIILSALEYFIQESFLFTIYHKAVMLIGILSIYQIVNLLTCGHPTSSIWYKSAPLSFFVFAFHEPTLTFIKKKLFIYASGSFSVLATYLASAALAIGISIGFYFIVKFVSPALLRHLVGGRTT